MKIYEKFLKLSIKRQYQQSKKAIHRMSYFHNMFDNGLTFRIHREFLILNNKKTTQLKTGQRT